MTLLADQFSTIFRDEHRAVRDALLELLEAFEQRSCEQAMDRLQYIAALTGPHFRYEEETMYPALVPTFGTAYVRRLYVDHDGAIASAKRLVELASQDELSDDDVTEAVALVRAILPHVSDCDGLSLMVERLSDDDVQAILDARDRCNEAGFDLLSWDEKVRTEPTLPVA